MFVSRIFCTCLRLRETSYTGYVLTSSYGSLFLLAIVGVRRCSMGVQTVACCSTTYLFRGSRMASAYRVMHQLSFRQHLPQHCDMSVRSHGVDRKGRAFHFDWSLFMHGCRLLRVMYASDGDQHPGRRGYGRGRSIHRIICPMTCRFISPIPINGVYQLLK